MTRKSLLLLTRSAILRDWSQIHEGGDILLFLVTIFDGERTGRFRLFMLPSSARVHLLYVRSSILDGRMMLVIR